MFGHRYFGARYWAPRFFGPSALEAVSVTGALASGVADVSGAASAFVDTDGVFVSAAATMDGVAGVVVAADGLLASASASVAGDVSVVLSVVGELSAGTASVDGTAAASIAADGDLVAGPASVEGEVTPDQISEFLHPNADVADDGWTGHDGGADLFQYINEAVANDADYVKSPVVPAGETFRVRVTNPVSAIALGSPIVVRYRIGKTDAGATINFRVRLFQGASEIAEWTHNNVAAGFSARAQTLTAPQIAAISDFDDLELEFEAEAAA